MDAPGFAVMLFLGFNLFVQEEKTITKKPQVSPIAKMLLVS